MNENPQSKLYETLAPDKLPDDLKALVADFNLPKDDPLIVLLAWHWIRVQKTQDVMQEGLMQLRGVFQERTSKLEILGKSIERLEIILPQVNANVADEHLKLKSKIEAELKLPIEQCQKLCSNIGNSLDKLFHKIETSWAETTQQKLICSVIAAFTAGLLLGLCVHFF